MLATATTARCSRSCSKSACVVACKCHAYTLARPLCTCSEKTHRAGETTDEFGIPSAYGKYVIAHERGGRGKHASCRSHCSSSPPPCTPDGRFALSLRFPEINLHWQAVACSSATTAAAFTKRLKKDLGWDKDRQPRGYRILSRALTGKLLHTVHGMIGFCLKDLGQKHFRYDMSPAVTQDVRACAQAQYMLSCTAYWLTSATNRTFNAAWRSTSSTERAT